MLKPPFHKACLALHVKASAILTYASILALILCAIPQAYAQSNCPSASSGVVTLALPSKRFPVDRAAAALSSSPHPSFAFVLRSFGTHYSNIGKLISKIRAEPNYPGCITVIVYGDCGPCRSPRRPAGLLNVLLPNLNISRLNRSLESAEVRTLRAYEKEWSGISHFLPEVSGVDYIFMPGLEDNYNGRSYAVLRSLAEQLFASRRDIAIGRNTLVGGLGGGGYPSELHSYRQSALGKLHSGDILTGDGDNLCFSGERCRGYSPTQIRQLALDARNQGVHFLLWRPDSSGLPIGIANNPVFTPVERRTYRVSGVPILQFILK